MQIFLIHDLVLILVAYICNYTSKNWQNSGFFTFFVTCCWNTEFFLLMMFCTAWFFCNWFSKYVNASPKIGKIHAFFTADFLKIAISVYTGCVNMQLFLWEAAKISCFSRQSQKNVLFFQLIFQQLFLQKPPNFALFSPQVIENRNIFWNSWSFVVWLDM